MEELPGLLVSDFDHVVLLVEAERMYTNAMLFLEGENVTVPKDLMKAKARALIQEGFRPQLALNFEY